MAKLRALLIEHGDRLEESLRQGADGTKPVDLDGPAVLDDLHPVPE